MVDQMLLSKCKSSTYKPQQTYKILQFCSVGTKMCNFFVSSDLLTYNIQNIYKMLNVV